jgi:hypothetical protein
VSGISIATIDAIEHVFHVATHTWHSALLLVTSRVLTLFGEEIDAGVKLHTPIRVWELMGHV